MTLVDLLKGTIKLPEDEVWENERTPTLVRVFGVQLHSMGLSGFVEIPLFKHNLV